MNIVVFMVRFLQEFSDVSGWENVRADNFPVLGSLPPAEPLGNRNTLGMLCAKNKLSKCLREGRAEGEFQQNVWDSRL